MIDLTDYMGTWYKALFMFALLILGGAFANYLIFGGEYSSHLSTTSFIAVIVGVIAYRQKQRGKIEHE